MRSQHRAGSARQVWVFDGDPVHKHCLAVKSVSCRHRPASTGLAGDRIGAGVLDRQMEWMDGMARCDMRHGVLLDLARSRQGVTGR